MLTHGGESVVSKPFLFGLYGALGCLLAAGAFGEPLWRVLVPLPPASRPALPLELRLVASDKVVLDQGAKNRFFVQIARAGFTTPVTLYCTGQPTGVHISEVTLPAEQTEAVLEVAAERQAPPGRYPLTLLGVAELVCQQVAVELILEPPPPSRGDVVFVLDVTGSMQWAIDGIQGGIQEFTRQLATREIDARIGLIAFRDRSVGEEPVILRFAGNVLTRDYEAFRREVSRLRAMGGGFDEPESSLDALVLAARQEFRPDAVRVVVLITDAGPRLPDQETPTVEAAARMLARHEIGQFHLMTLLAHKRKYEALQRQAPGSFFDLQQAARGSGEGFAQLLPHLGETIARITLANRPPTPLAPSQRPPPLPPVGIKAMQSNVEFDANAAARLVVALAIWTATLAAGTSLALVAGQSWYLRGGLPPVLAWLRAAGGGLLAGLVAGGVGQLLYQTSGGLWADPAFRLLGWLVLGALVGGGMSFCIPNLRFRSGVLGGAMGGGAGALGFVAVTWLLRSTPGGDLPGRLLGAAVLGFALGLMVAWAERVSRHFWLELRWGKESRSVNLGTTPVSFGSNGRACTVFVPQVLPLAGTYRVQDGEVIWEDGATGGSSPVRPGDERRIGTLQIKLFAASVTEGTGPPPIKACPPPPPPPAVRPNQQAAKPKPEEVKPNPPTVRRPPPPPPPVKR